MAEWSDELKRGQLRERTILGQSLVVFRDASGHARALTNRCPHRFAPLHLGTCLESGEISCGYHGLRFNGDGECVGNPHGNGHIPSAARVRAYPVAEKHGIVWVWTGAVEACDEALLPDYGAIDPQRSHSARRFLTVKANYQLESDNILDLSHIQFLHPGSLGSDAVSQAAVKVVQEGNTVHSRRFIQGEILPPFLETTFGIPHGSPADRWLDVRWSPPASLLLSVTIAVSGAPREEGATILMPHIFTPETDSTTHYWFASCFDRQRYPDGKERAERHVEGLMKPFATEDLPMLEAQQKVIGDADFWSLKPVLLRSDEAAVRARRVLDGLISREGATREEAVAEVSVTGRP